MMPVRTVISWIVVLGLLGVFFSVVSFAKGNVSKTAPDQKVTTAKVDAQSTSLNVKTPNTGGEKPIMVAQAQPDAKGAVPRQVLLDDMLRTAKGYFDEGNAQAAKYIGVSSDEYAKARKEFIVPMLNALKLLLENGIPKDDARPVVPGIDRFDLPTGDPGQEAALKKQTEQIEARKIALLMNDLISLRVMLVRNIAGYYLQEPYATDELRQLASDTLKNDAAVGELMAEVETNVTPPANPSVTIQFEPQ